MTTYKKDSFYWVLFDEKWEPAQYIGNEKWHLINSECNWHTSKLNAIGTEISKINGKDV